MYESAAPTFATQFVAISLQNVHTVLREELRSLLNRTMVGIHDDHLIPEDPSMGADSGLLASDAAPDAGAADESPSPATIAAGIATAIIVLACIAVVVSQCVAGEVLPLHSPPQRKTSPRFLRGKRRPARPGRVVATRGDTSPAKTSRQRDAPTTNGTLPLPPIEEV